MVCVILSIEVFMALDEEGLGWVYGV